MIQYIDLEMTDVTIMLVAATARDTAFSLTCGADFRDSAPSISMILSLFISIIPILQHVKSRRCSLCVPLRPSAPSLPNGLNTIGLLLSISPDPHFPLAPLPPSSRNIDNDVPMTIINGNRPIDLPKTRLCSMTGLRTRMAKCTWGTH